MARNPHIASNPDDELSEKRMIFPDDENGDVLRRMEAGGDDLTRPRDLDFTVVFPSEDAANQFAEEFRNQGYRTSVRFAEVEEDCPWDVIVVKNMVPTHEGITDFESALQNAADALGGHNDGWGGFHQPSSN